MMTWVLLIIVAMLAVLIKGRYRYHYTIEICKYIITISAILLGVFLGLYLRERTESDNKKQRVLSIVEKEVKATQEKIKWTVFLYGNFNFMQPEYQDLHPPKDSQIKRNIKSLQIEVPQTLEYLITDQDFRYIIPSDQYVSLCNMRKSIEKLCYMINNEEYDAMIFANYPVYYHFLNELEVQLLEIKNGLKNIYIDKELDNRKKDLDLRRHNIFDHLYIKKAFKKEFPESRFK